MIVVHFSQDFRKGKPQLGGFSRISGQTCDGNRHIVFTIGETDETFEVENLTGHSIQVFQVGLKKINCYSLKNQLLNAPKIVREILIVLKEKQINPDFLFGHAQLFNYYILFLIRVFKFKKAKLIWEFNVVWSFERSGGLKVKLRSYLQRFSQGFIIKKADGLLFQTKSARDFIFEKYKCEHHSTVVIENSVDVSNSMPVVDRLYSSVFLVYGLFDELNGIRFLLDTFHKYKNSDIPEIHFLGNGTLVNEVIQFCEENPKHKYLGSVEKSQISVILKEYAFGLIPRIDTLGSRLYIPTKVVEMMNLGLVVLGSNVSGLTEVIENEKNGFIYTEGDGLDMIQKMKYMVGLDEVYLKQIREAALIKLRQSFNSALKLEQQKSFLTDLVNS
jgi:glycosyltransferase involved in cell wall biosynthesis